MIFKPICLALLFCNIITIYSLANSTSNPECLYDGCKCVKFGDAYDILCVAENSSTLEYYPKRLNLSGITKINTLLIKKFNFRSIPDDYFKDLSINNLIIGENNLEVITKNAFRGVQSILLLRIIEKDLDLFEKSSMSWLNDKLSEIGIWQLNFKSENINSIFTELTNLKGLKTLKIMGYGLKKFRQSWIPLFKNIHSLGLSSNDLSSLQSDLFRSSTNLISLDLSNNYLDDLNDTLAALEPIKDILKELKLNGNTIEKLVDFPKFKNLEILDLSNNRIKSITSTTFLSLSALSHLYLSDNKLNSIDEHAFGKNKNLAVLLLSSNYLSRVPNLREQLRLQIVDLSNQNKQLTSLHDYAFERKLRPMNPISLNLDTNEIVKFGNKTFCSRNSNVSEILGLDLAFGALKHFNKCLLKQVNSKISPKIVIRVGIVVDRKNITDVCSCSLKLYAAKNKIDITGGCDIPNQICDSKMYKFNECSSSEFNCDH